MADTLTRVAELARDATPDVAFAGMTMMVDDRPATTVFTDEQSPEIDQAQYEVDDGPCLESFRTAEIRVIDSTLDEDRWPAFREACLRHGIFSTMSSPIAQGTTRLGALNLYSRKEKTFDDDAIAAVQLFAEQASIVVANATAYWDARALAEQLSESIASRSIIEQAKGIIMGSMRCSADRAFEYLVDQSQRTNTKLRVVAQSIVDGVSGPARG